MLCYFYLSILFCALTTHWNKQKNHPNKLLTYLIFFLIRHKNKDFEIKFFSHFYELLLLLLLLKQNVHPNSPHAHIPALIQTQSKTKSIKKIYKKNIHPNNCTYFWMRESGAKTPCLGRHVKYWTPPTAPLFFPAGRSSSTPNHVPGTEPFFTSDFSFIVPLTYSKFLQLCHYLTNSKFLQLCHYLTYSEFLYCGIT